MDITNDRQKLRDYRFGANLRLKCLFNSNPPNCSESISSFWRPASAIIIFSSGMAHNVASMFSHWNVFASRYSTLSGCVGRAR